MKDQGNPYNYVGVNVAKSDDGQYVFTQPSLIDRIINDVVVGTKQRKSVHMSAHKLLHHFLNSLPQNPQPLTANQL